MNLGPVNRCVKKVPLLNSSNFRRYVENKTLFTELVETASSQPEYREVLGGNAPVMASRFAKEGCEVVLAAQMTKSLQASLPDIVKGKTIFSTLNIGPIHKDLKY